MIINILHFNIAHSTRSSDIFAFDLQVEVVRLATSPADVELKLT